MTNQFLLDERMAYYGPGTNDHIDNYYSTTKLIFKLNMMFLKVQINNTSHYKV